MTTSLERLYEARGLLAINKPPRLPVVPGRGEAEGPSLRAQVEAELGRQVWVVHRLDRDTSGVLLLALDAKTHRTLSMAFERGAVEKVYWALVDGRVEAPREIHRALVPARRGRMRIAREGETGKDALTRIAPLEVFSAATLVEARPQTGRTHQLRVHLASAGHRLLVDHQYGQPEPFPLAPGAPPLARTPLHARSLRLPALDHLSPVEIVAPAPADFVATLEHLRAISRR